MKNLEAFHKPLHPKDSDKRTSGCRHTNSDNCGKNRLPKVCAFVRADGMCEKPPRSWRKQYQKLKEMQPNVECHVTAD